MTTDTELAALVPAVNDLLPALEPWEQQTGETKTAYGAFVNYRDTGPGVRGVRKTAEALNKSHATVAHWSKKHAWVARAAVWDRKIAREAAAAMADERVKALERQAKIGTRALDKVEEWVEQIDPSKLTARDAIRLLDVASRVQRAGLGIADRHEFSGPGGGPIPLDTMTAEERRAELDGALVALAARAPQDAPGEPA